MNRTTLGLVLGAGVLASGLAVWWLRKPAPPPVVDDRADYRLERFEMSALRQDGSEGFTVTGPLLERDEQGSATVLTEPRFGFPARQPGQRWQARAASAWVGPDNDEVRLLGGVEMDGPPDRRGEAVRFSTDHLTVLPETDRARTDAAVTVTQGASILRATGLDVDLKAQTYELLADVDATFPPRPARPRAAPGPVASAR
ncbi:MAG: LPS export ABC transporter periplasmic protein LptC [Lysobacteraceae bacterium]|jgi:lipopolysaccharide export system protein LptC|nr:LPS export ABC transporter periplasmic protein LptC [Xanthomonadaceae bacterium]MCZ8319647.1 LPS export ABC transporter periplasmic protein LptC [Silanimonas sp.]